MKKSLKQLKKMWFDEAKSNYSELELMRQVVAYCNNKIEETNDGKTMNQLTKEYLMYYFFCY